MTLKTPLTCLLITLSAVAGAAAVSPAYAKPSQYSLCSNGKVDPGEQCKEPGVSCPTDGRGGSGSGPTCWNCRCGVKKKCAPMGVKVTPVSCCKGLVWYPRFDVNYGQCEKPVPGVNCFGKGQTFVCSKYANQQDGISQCCPGLKVDLTKKPLPGQHGTCGGICE